MKHLRKTDGHLVKHGGHLALGCTEIVEYLQAKRCGTDANVDEWATIVDSTHISITGIGTVKLPYFYHTLLDATTCFYFKSTNHKSTTAGTMLDGTTILSVVGCCSNPRPPDASWLSLTNCCDLTTLAGWVRTTDYQSWKDFYSTSTDVAISTGETMCVKIGEYYLKDAPPVDQQRLMSDYGPADGCDDPDCPSCCQCNPDENPSTVSVSAADLLPCDICGLTTDDAHEDATEWDGTVPEQLGEGDVRECNFQTGTFDGTDGHPYKTLNGYPLLAVAVSASGTCVSADCPDQELCPSTCGRYATTITFGVPGGTTCSFTYFKCGGSTVLGAYTNPDGTYCKHDVSVG